MSTTEALAAINKTIVVEASQETAFETFTRQATSWWPRSHTIFEDKASYEVRDEAGNNHWHSSDRSRNRARRS